MSTRLGLFCLTLGLCVPACRHEKEGPAVALSGIEPQVICNAQRATAITVRGEALSPLNDLLLTQPQLELPRLALERTHAADGTPVAPPEIVTVPDDPLAPQLSDVTWISQQQMTFAVCPPGTCSTSMPPKTDYVLMTGLYALSATNRNDTSARLGDILAVVPPPTLVSVVDLLCKDKENQLALSGDDFLRLNGTPVTVTIGGRSFLASSMSDCRPLSAPAGITLEACRRVTITIPAGTFDSGTYDVSVANPEPAGCKTTQATRITFVPEPTLISVVPDLICDAQQAQTLTLTGMNFLTIDGVLPTVHIGTMDFSASTATGCTPLVGPKEVVQVCTTLTVSVPVLALAPMSYPLTVTNPPPADCTSKPPLALTVVPPPVLMSVAPPTLCTGGGTLMLGGTGFRPGATVRVGTTTTSSVTVDTGGTSATALFGPASFGGPFDVTWTNADGCFSALPAGVTVVNGALMLFIDPSVVWNGVATPITLYGTGFTLPFTKVQLRAKTTGLITDLATNPPGVPTAAGHADRPVVIVPKLLAADTYSVVVSDSSGCAGIVLPDALKVVQQTTLQLAGISPKFGWTGSNTAVTITANPATPFNALPRVYLSNGTNLVALGAVARVTNTSLSALVPKGVTPGVYDVIVVNPQDGTVGVLTQAFTVLLNRPPSVTAVNPPQLSNAVALAQTLTITGADFATPTVTLRCQDPRGMSYADQGPLTPTASSTTSITVSVDAFRYSGIAGGPQGANCIVVVTNGNLATAEFSSLVIVSAMQDLSNWIQTGPQLTTARRGLGVASGEVTQSARFVYAIGGDDGVSAQRSVEVLPVDIFGLPSSTGFFTQRNLLNTARTQTSAARIGRFIYVVGGTSVMGGDASALGTLERAPILDPAMAPSNLNVDIALDPTIGLGGGVYYYRVAAVLPSTDKFDPNGETLPSEAFGVILPSLVNQKIQITLSWNAVKDSSGAAASAYLIYRSAANDPAGTETLIADTRALPGTVTCTAPTATSASCTDKGATNASTQAPLQLGSTGLWQTLTTLPMGKKRQGPGVTFAFDPVTPTTAAYIYVFGGKDETATPLLGSYEYLPITIAADGGQTPGSWSSLATFGAARWDLRAWSTVLVHSPALASDGTYVFAGGGYLTTGIANPSTDVDGAKVAAGGALGTFTTTSGSMPNEAGFGAFAAGDFLYAVGGQQGIPDKTGSSYRLGTVLPQATPGGWQSAGAGLGMARVDLGATIQSGYFYAIGGFGGPSATPPPAHTVLRSIEYVLY